MIEDERRELDSESLRQEAEQLFVDALLEEALQVDGEQRNAKIAELVGRLPRRRPHWRGFGTLAAAAAVFALLWLLFGNGARQPEALLAFVRKAHAESETAGDRQYEVRVFGWREGRKVMRFHSRGAESFLLEFDSVLGISRLGVHEGRAWFVPGVALLPVRVSRSHFCMTTWIERLGLDLAVVDARTVLSQLGEGWRLDELPDAGNSTTLRLRAEPRVAARKRIEFEADRETGKVRVLRTYVKPPRSGRFRLRMEMELVGERELPGNWFTHGAHHGPDRRVHRR